MNLCESSFWWSAGRGASRALAGLAVALAGLCVARSASASGFTGCLLVGPGYMSTSSANDYGDSSGPAVLAQLDAGVKVSPTLVLHSTLLYDFSEWLQFSAGGDRYSGSMFGFGLGGTLSFGGFSVGASGGGQFTFFPQADDPASGPNGASLGWFLSANAGYDWAVSEAARVGVHLLARYRSSKDETNSIVYDPSGYQLGVAVSVGLGG
ncbi:MAG TPA: hypothetical protein VNN80_35295 [Polyangiaceae bacterium]|jgi:hypothetical protein|nr:hypothetical protein [Polyangiaceae bacterium]